MIRITAAVAAAAVGLLSGGFVAEAGPVSGNPRILIRTEMGDITAEIYADRAPITAANFLRYVDAGLYDGTVFFRTVTLQNQRPDEVKIEVVQAAGIDEKNEFPPIKLERTFATGIRHLDGTLSMARAEPDSAASSFSICINDQPELDFDGKRNKDGHGFAAFGRVVSGMSVVRRIQAAPHHGQTLTPPIKIISIARASK